MVVALLSLYEGAFLELAYRNGQVGNDSVLFAYTHPYLESNTSPFLEAALFNLFRPALAVHSGFYWCGDCVSVDCEWGFDFSRATCSAPSPCDAGSPAPSGPFSGSR